MLVGDRVINVQEVDSANCTVEFSFVILRRCQGLLEGVQCNLTQIIFLHFKNPVLKM